MEGDASDGGGGGVVNIMIATLIIGLLILMRKNSNGMGDLSTGRTQFRPSNKEITGTATARRCSRYGSSIFDTTTNPLYYATSQPNTQECS